MATALSVLVVLRERVGWRPVSLGAAIPAESFVPLMVLFWLGLEGNCGSLEPRLKPAVLPVFALWTIALPTRKGHLLDHFAHWHASGEQTEQLSFFVCELAEGSDSASIGPSSSSARLQSPAVRPPDPTVA
jgi:hypothetical protein